MQYTLAELLREEHILVGIEVEDAQQAILQLTGALLQTEHVVPGFAEDVWNRELVFPTGLPTRPLAVAIPHADPDHVQQSAVCVGVLSSPVQFGQMGTDGSARLDVRLIFMLAIKEREKQVEMIQQLISLIQSAELLEGLAAARGPAQALALITDILAGKGHNAEG